MITRERIKELIKEHDESPDSNLGGLNFLSTMTKMWTEHAGVKWMSELGAPPGTPSDEIWDCLSREQRDCVMGEVKQLVIDTLEATGG